jgi:hypothetical protein
LFVASKRQHSHFERFIVQPEGRFSGSSTLTNQFLTSTSLFPCPSTSAGESKVPPELDRLVEIPVGAELN